MTSGEPSAAAREELWGLLDEILGVHTDADRECVNRLLDAFEARVDAAITMRLLEFEEALVERGQIEKSYPPEPPRIRGPLCEGACGV